MGEDYVIPFEQQDPIQFGTGPFTMENRYITEDIPVGCHVYHELGKKFAVQTPVVDSMINLASAILGRDFYKVGYTLDYLGIGHMNKAEMNAYLREGTYKVK